MLIVPVSSYPFFPCLIAPSDLVMWMKKRGRRGRHFRREELLAFLSGKAPPPAASMRPTIMSSGGAASGVGGAVSSSPAASLNATSHLHHSHRKGGAAFLSSHCLSDAAIGGGNVGALHHHHHHHHHPHPHHRRSLSASPSLTDANVWMPTDFATSSTGFLDGKNENNNSLQQSNSLFLEPDLRSFRDAQTVSYAKSRLVFVTIVLLSRLSYLGQVSII